MLQAARRRVRSLDNVEIRRGSLESLPIPDATLDAVTCVLVLHHLPAPGVALAEAARALKPGGRLLLVDMMPHDREAYRQQMGHVWLGFSEPEIGRHLVDAGFEAVRHLPLPPDSSAQGPTLFAAAARRAAVLTRSTSRNGSSRNPNATPIDEGESR
jgi:ArsR family transcriptional regulator